MQWPTTLVLDLSGFPSLSFDAVGVMILLLGVYAIIECIRAVIATERSPERYLRWWPFVALGITDVVVGILTFLWLDAPTLELLYLSAGWAALAGIITVAGAMRRRQSVMGEWLLGLGGVATVVLAGYLALHPFPGLITAGWFAGLYLFVFLALAVIFVAEWRRLKN